MKQFSIVVQTGNYSGEIIREAIFLGEISWEGDNCAGGGSYCSEGNCSGAIVRGKNLGDYCPGSNFMGGGGVIAWGGSCPEGIVRGQLSRGNCC